MHTTKTIAEFHFDTEKSGVVLSAFLLEAHISRAEAAKRIGLAYDTLVDALKGKNKDSKLELVVKICHITGRTIHEWCEMMLEGVHDELADQVRAVFATPVPTEHANLDDIITHYVDAQEHSVEHYKAVLRACYDELRASKEQMRQHYEAQVAFLQEENRRLIDALITK